MSDDRELPPISVTYCLNPLSKLLKMGTKWYSSHGVLSNLTEFIKALLSC